MPGRAIQSESSESPLTSLEDSPIKRTVAKKRQRIDSEEDVGDDDDLPLQGSSKPRRVAPTFSSDDEGEDQSAEDQPASTTGRIRKRVVAPSSPRPGPIKAYKKEPTVKGKVKADGPPKKRKKKVDDFASEVSDEFEDPDVEMELNEEEDFVEPSEEEDTKSRGQGKGRGGGKAGKKGGGVKELLVKAKDESSRPKVKPTMKLSVKSDEMEVDIVGGGESPPPPADDARNSPLTPAVVPKKRKLPTIKKLKAVDSAGPSTPSTTDVLSNIKSASTGARKPAAYVGVSDLNLNNADIYTELFSKKGPNASRSNTREESKKKIEAMRAEWKAKREAELMQAPPFDLQAQQEKLARFEEKLRSVRSAALYPNFLAGKWREIWEKERNRARAEQAASQDGRTLTVVNGVTPNGREEGEHDE